jgi:hypothetical protein
MWKTGKYAAFREFLCGSGPSLYVVVLVRGTAAIGGASMLLDEEFQGKNKLEAKEKEEEKVLSRRERPDRHRKPPLRKPRVKNGRERQR